jgi:hypothetical protein
LHKITKITEGTAVELRAEYFNVFNRTPFGLPNGVCNITNTGQPCAYSMGVVNSTISNENNRIGQLGAKFTF